MEQTRQRVDARQGTVELDGNWRASYGTVHRATGDFVVLSLRDPKGALLLTMDIPLQTVNCAMASQVDPTMPHPTIDVTQAPQNDRYTSVITPNQPKDNH
jgi:hypothetical protein